MMDFFAGCAGLFTDTFNAAIGQDFFMFLISFLMFQLFVMIFRLACKTVGKR